MSCARIVEKDSSFVGEIYAEWVEIPSEEGIEEWRIVTKECRTREDAEAELIDYAKKGGLYY